MRRIQLLLGLLIVCLTTTAHPPKRIKRATECRTVERRTVPNDFFVLHNAIRGDSTYKTFDQQVALIKSLGYDGVEINQLESFEGMKTALDKHRFTGSYFYIRVNLDQPELDPRIEPYIRALAGSKTILAPFIVGDKTRFPPGRHSAGRHSAGRHSAGRHPASSGVADSVVVRHLRQMADWAKAAGLTIALYPHVGFYVERADHALQLVEQVARPNVGLTFNLCHWLATREGGPVAFRYDWKPLLAKLKPHLKMMTICGANDVPLTQAAKEPGGLWNDYIKLLGTGSFDTYELVRYAVQELGFRGPIGVQFYALKGDKPTNLRQTMAVWQEYQTRFPRLR
ncbi:sugar phosphate isomerase/epimerase family protein [Spirosoma montaniterrae]|uniref:Xylose isomerase-like TIM barrel domain-containing protein n=1 Tax=Spirosoma montaniterrae TaxID=1178516 RepID=A0A1P9WRM5_9BACT|nr:TIM barrel protein [Spirosoma montaniterrae]AQG78010.1 hypothetical protein AWR27_00770 [Spirosoma montaniterrae]